MGAWREGDSIAGNSSLERGGVGLESEVEGNRMLQEIEEREHGMNCLQLRDWNRGHRLKEISA